MNWMEILAAFVNGVLILVVVQFLKVKGMPYLKVHAPFVLPILALVAGPLFAYLTAIVSGLIGYPIDFSAIVAVLTGAVAIVVYDLGDGLSKTIKG